MGSSRSGLGRLEQTVLSFLGASDIEVSTYEDLIDAVVPEDVAGSPTEWCRPQRVKIPLGENRGDLEKRTFLLRCVMEKMRVKPAFVSSRVVSPRRFNESIASTGNKQATLFTHVAALIRQAVEAHGGKLARVNVDKLGSTRRYTGLLDRFLGGWSVHAESEERHRSTYRVTHPDGSFELSFVRQGDQTEFLIALASMQSKYLREIEMRVFNAFWKRHAPKVASTAGYYTDGRRFLTQIRPYAVRVGIPEEDFVRLR